MTHSAKHVLIRTFIATSVALALLTAGCGGGDDDKNDASADGDANSEYCDIAARWAAHELSGGGDAVADDPAALRKYWGEYVQFMEDGTRLAPPSLRDEWDVGYEYPKVEVTAVFEKYDYDVARIQAEGTDAEKNLRQEPNPEEQVAQDAVHEYESRVCGAGFPPAADESFDGVEADAGYCDAVAAFNDAADEEVAAKAFAPAAMRGFVTSDAYAQLLDAQETNAPAEIDEDVHSFIEWNRTEWTDVVAKYDYDIRKLMLDGTPAERATLNYTDRSIADAYARTTAYEEQLCAL